MLTARYPYPIRETGGTPLIPQSWAEVISEDFDSSGAGPGSSGESCSGFYGGRWHAFKGGGMERRVGVWRRRSSVRTRTKNRLRSSW